MKNRTNENKKNANGLFSFIGKATLLIVIALLAAKFIFTGFSAKESQVTIWQLEKALESCEDLCTYKYTYTDKANYESFRTLFDKWRIPFTTSSLDYTVSGEIRCGISLTNVKPEKDDLLKVIKIHLPDAETQDHVLDIVDSQDKNNLLNLLGTEDFDTFLEEIKEQEKGQALEDGLIEKANQHAKDIILDMFSSFDDYRVVFY